MERQRITCPETTNLELLDYERTPLGVVIEGCSRFLPRCGLECSRECAARIDHRGGRSDHSARAGRDTIPFQSGAARRLLPSGT
jgi:hypothetical protein